MADAFKAGDKVTWNSPQGTVHGTVKKKLTAPTHIKGHDVAASKDHPEYLVVSDKTGAEAAHHASALTKIQHAPKPLTKNQVAVAIDRLIHDLWKMESLSRKGLLRDDAYCKD